MDKTIDTSLTRFLGTQVPIVGANMAGASGGALAAEVSLAGGFGFLAIGYEKQEQFEEQLNLAETRLLPKFGHENVLKHIGVGALGWMLAEPGSERPDFLRLAISRGVRDIWLSFGDDLGNWVKFVRNIDNSMKVRVWVVVSTLEEARRAVEDWKVDILVAQGIQAGGHGLSTAPPILTLLPSILSASWLPCDLPVVVAGGISSPSSLEKLLSADFSSQIGGFILGTVLCATEESLFTDTARAALVQASDSVRSTAFDVARGTNCWPAGIDGRGLINATITEDVPAGLTDSEMAQKYKEDPEGRRIVWAGANVGEIKEVKPAGKVVEEFHQALVKWVDGKHSV